MNVLLRQEYGCYLEEEKPALKRHGKNIRSKSVGSSPRGSSKKDKTCKNVKSKNFVFPEKTSSIPPKISSKFSTLTSTSKKQKAEHIYISNSDNCSGINTSSLIMACGGEGGVNKRIRQFNDITCTESEIITSRAGSNQSRH